MRTFALHLGTREPATLLELLPAQARVFRDGDDWEEWGEPIQGAEHIVVFADDTAELLADVAYLVGEGANLVRMEHPGQEGVFACITQAEDWSESIYLLRDEPYRRILVER